MSSLHTLSEVVSSRHYRFLILYCVGLWIVDLSVTQILQERVDENRRGVINGVQDSMNNSMDLLKNVLTIVLPKPKTFGILIILSFTSISLGWLFYTTYFCKRIKTPPPSAAASTHDDGHPSIIKSQADPAALASSVASHSAFDGTADERTVLNV